MKSLRKFTLGASFFLANQACLPVHNLTKNFEESILEEKVESKSDQLIHRLKSTGLDISHIQKLKIASETSISSFVFSSSNYSEIDSKRLQVIYKELGYLSLIVETNDNTFYIALRKSEFLALKNINPCSIEKSDLDYHLLRRKFNLIVKDSFMIDTEYTLKSFYFEVFNKSHENQDLVSILSDILTKTKFTPLLFNDYENQKIIAVAVDVSEILDPIDPSVVHQITSDTSDQACQQLDVESNTKDSHALLNLIADLESAGFTVHSYDEYLTQSHTHFLDPIEQLGNEVKRKFVNHPNSASLIVSKQGVDTDQEFKELLIITSHSKICNIQVSKPLINSEDNLYELKAFCGKRKRK